VESVFFLAESLTVLIWAIASDKFGRRPILIFGPLGLAIATLCFGLSTKYFELVLFRSVQGIFNGNIGVSKTVLAELSDPTNVARIYSFSGPTWTAGIIFGSFIGGYLSNPQERFPSHIGKIPLLQDHPYFLPCAFVAFIALSIFLLALFGLRETHHVRWRIPRGFKSGLLKKKVSQNDLAVKPFLTSSTPNPSYGSIRTPSSSSLSSAPSEDAPTLALDPDLESDQDTVCSESEDGVDVEPPVSFKSVLVPDVLIPILNYAFVTFLDSSFVVLAPLAYTTSVSAGGMGLTPPDVGFILFCAGLVNIPFPLCVPKLIERFGPRRCYLTGMSSFFWGFGGLWLLSRWTEMNGHATGLIRAILPVHYMTYYLLDTLPYVTADLFVINGVPSKSVMGTANGLCQTAKTIGRTLGPVFATSLFSFSKAHNVLEGHLVYLVLLLIASVALRTACYLPNEFKKL
jgi:MFS family permease